MSQQRTGKMPKQTLQPTDRPGVRFAMSPLHLNSNQNEQTPNMEALKGRGNIAPPRQHHLKQQHKAGMPEKTLPTLNQQRLFASPLETGRRHRQRAFSKSPAMSPIDDDSGSKSPMWFVCKPNGTIYPRSGRDARNQAQQQRANPKGASRMRPAKETASSAAATRRVVTDTLKCVAEKPLETSFERILSKSLTPPARTHSPSERSHLDDTLSVGNILDANGLAHLIPEFTRRQIDMDMFFSMNDTNLQMIGVSAPESKQILEIIQGMVGNSSP